MTASVQYWRLPEEEAELVAYLESLEPTVALPLRRVATADKVVWQPLAEALRAPDAAFLITPARFAGELKIHHGEDGYAANVTTTPALHYSRGQLVTPQRLSSTGLSAIWNDHPDELVRWGKKVMQWVRHVAPSWYRYKHHRITPKAEAAREAGMEMTF